MTTSTTESTEYLVIAFHGSKTLTAIVDAHADTIEAARRLIQDVTNVLLPCDQFVQIGTYTATPATRIPPATLILTAVSHVDSADAARDYVSEHFDGIHTAWKPLS